MPTFLNPKKVVMIVEQVVLLKPEGDPVKVCELAKKSYSDGVKLGIKYFRFLVITDKELKHWISYVKCLVSSCKEGKVIITQVSDVEAELIASKLGVKVVKLGDNN